MFLTSGDRQENEPAQILKEARGKIHRLTLDGKPVDGNPFPDAPSVWTLGHRNPYGLVFDDAGQLWSHEMGPCGGDELNLIVKGQNYGWPIVSERRKYSGLPIPNHASRPDFSPPTTEWSPVIAPSGMIYYSGKFFPEWKGSLIIVGLASQSLVRVEVNGTTEREVERWSIGSRVRDGAADLQGNIFVLEDNGTLLRLVQQD